MGDWSRNRGERNWENIARQNYLGGQFLHRGFDWGGSSPIIDEIGRGADFNKVTGALTSVGLGTVPSWLKPYGVLSMGEKFRADLARIIIESPEKVIIDEFTSVVDRQIAKIGSAAFAKSWRKTGGQCIVLSCHYDIIDWLQPDWVLDTRDWGFEWRCLRRRPEIPLELYQTNSSPWKIFKKHHYLDLVLPVAATYYTGCVSGEPVCFLAVCTMAGMKQCRFTRLVVHPEWQGAGVGMSFLETIAEMWLKGENRYGIKMPGIIHTSHPGLIIALSRSKKWVCKSQQMGGGHRGKSKRSIAKSSTGISKGGKTTGGYGGHFRAVNGFKYIGEKNA